MPDDTLRSRDISPASSAGASEVTTGSLSAKCSDDARRKWSEAEQKELMFCYYKAKVGGAGYTKRFEKLFKNRNPNNPKIHKFTANTLASQARCIIARKNLSIEVLDEIRTTAENDETDALAPRERSTQTPPRNTLTQSLITTRQLRSPTPDTTTQQQIETNTRTQSTYVLQLTGRTTGTLTSQSDDSRRKWSEPELHELMFCFYKAKSEGPGFMKRLDRLFKNRNPDNIKSQKFDGNKLANQARNTIEREVLSKQVLDKIKHVAENGESHITTPDHINSHTSHEVVFTQTPHNDRINITPSPDLFTQNTEALSNLHTIQEDPSDLVVETIDTSDIEVDEDQDPLILQFLQTLSETREITVEERETLPKPIFNKQFIQNLHKINSYLPNLLKTYKSLREINDIIYASAKTLIYVNGQKSYVPPTTRKPKREQPWQIRLRKKIDAFRKELARLIEIKRGNNSRALIRIKGELYNKYDIRNEQDLDYTIEIHTQKVKALAGRLKRYNDMNETKLHNKLYQENQHKFFRSLNGEQQAPAQIPSQNEVQKFWSSILSEPVPLYTEAGWIRQVEESMEEIEIEDTNMDIDTKTLKVAIRKIQNWKAPGIDKIQNYYLKYLTSTHKYIAQLFDRIVKGIEPIENWFTTGKVVLIPKNEETQDPKNWRPIACLPTMYKLLTSVLANELYTHCDKNNILEPEQRGCRRRARGCKDHLMINKVILEDANQRQKNLSMAWVDYQKAFDSISHEWLLKVLDIYKCPPAIKRFLELTMPLWNVIMTAYGTNASITTDPIYIRRGIFQGDSLSPLLFCLALNPLSHILNEYLAKGYKLKDNSTINHLLYMDDLKLYANTPNNLKTLINKTEIFTEDIGMKFGLNKCNVLHLARGKRQKHEGAGHVLLSGEEFKHLKSDEHYKYLGVHESGKIDHNELRQQVQKEYLRRVKHLTKSHLNARNLLRSINIYAVPVLLYTFGIINYKTSDLKKIDVKTRKILAINKVQQQKADVERLYLPIEEGGRGLTNLEMLYKTQIIKYRRYLQSEQDHLISAIVKHDKNRIKHSIYKETQINLVGLGLENNENYTDKEIKNAVIKTKVTLWKTKPLHGQFYNKVLDRENIDKANSFKWIIKQPVSSSIESAIFAIQDQAVMTRQHERDILKKEVNGKCRLCTTKDETIQHVTSGCEKLAGTYYTRRHNNIVQYVHWTLAKKHKFEVSRHWWKENLTQPQVKENDEAKIMWEIPVQTDNTITHNRPDIIYINKLENKTYLIDITVPSDYNIGAKEIEKLSKYQALKVEVNRLWRTSTEVIPIVVGATGVIGKSLHKYCNKLDSYINIHIIQKQAAIHTVSIVSKVLGDTVFVNRGGNIRNNRVNERGGNESNEEDRGERRRDDESEVPFP